MRGDDPKSYRPKSFSCCVWWRQYFPSFIDVDDDDDDGWINVSIYIPQIYIPKKIVKAFMQIDLPSHTHTHTQSSIFGPHSIYIFIFASNCIPFYDHF